MVHHSLPAWLASRLEKIEGFKLYNWISHCINVFELANKRNFMVCSSPSSGKTVLGTLLSLRYKITQLNGKIIVVAPSLKIAKQWRKEFKRWGLDLKMKHKWSKNDPDNLESDYDGVVMTYAKMAQNHESIRRFCHYHKCFVVLDEIHHLSDELSWGISAENAFAVPTVDNIIALSGTPFRSDKTDIPFVEYHPPTLNVVVDDDGNLVEKLSRKVKADFEFTYREGMQSKHCRHLHFDCLQGNFEWISMGRPMVANFEKELNEMEEGRRLGTALNWNLDYVKKLTTKAIKRLDKVRLKHRNAAMLLVTKNLKDAEKAEKWIKLNFPDKKVVLVHSESPDDPQDTLDQFDESDAHICICVDMVTEGVDIKKFRVIVYATNKLTRLRFNQTVHRGTRRLGEEDKVCYVFIPCDKRALRFAKELLDEVFEDVDFDIEDDLDTPKKKDTKDPSSDFPDNSYEAKHSEAGTEEYIDIGPDGTNHSDSSVIEFAKRWMASHDIIEDEMEVSTAIKTISRQQKNGTFRMGESSCDLDDLFGKTEQPPQLTLEEQKSAVISEIESKMGYVAKITLKLPNGKMFILHNLYKQLGNKPQAQLTLDELKNKLRWIEDKQRNGFTAEETRLIEAMKRW